jgi:hypothetical protein
MESPVRVLHTVRLDKAESIAQALSRYDGRGSTYAPAPKREPWLTRIFCANVLTRCSATSIAWNASRASSAMRCFDAHDSRGAGHGLQLQTNERAATRRIQVGDASPVSRRQVSRSPSQQQVSNTHVEGLGAFASRDVATDKRAKRPSRKWSRMVSEAY